MAFFWGRLLLPRCWNVSGWNSGLFFGRLSPGTLRCTPASGVSSVSAAFALLLACLRVEFRAALVLLFRCVRLDFGNFL